MIISSNSDGVTVPRRASFEVSLEEIKKRAKDPNSGKPIAVDDAGQANTEGKGTVVPKGTFHT